jgi:hypothetical protein
VRLAYVEDVEHQFEEELVVEVVHVVVVLFGQNDDQGGQDLLQELDSGVDAAWLRVVVDHSLQKDGNHLGDEVDVSVVQLDLLSAGVVESG